MIKSGLAIHCHHNILFEHCYNYDERVEAIKRDKPQNEQEIRLRLFKMLPQEAINDLPKKLVKAYAEWEKVYAEREKAYAEWEKAYAERGKAYAEREKAYAEWEEAYAEWEKTYAEWKKTDAEREKAYAEWKKTDAERKKTDCETWHKKWCGCEEWNGKEIIF